MNDTLTQKIANPFIIAICILVITASVGLLATPYFFLAVVPPLLVTGFICLLRWPAIGYYLIVFLIPFGAYRGYKLIQLPWIIAMGLLLVVIFQYLPKKRLPENAAFNLWPWLIAFFMINTVSALFSPFPPVALKNLILFAIGYLFIFLSLIFVTKDGMMKTMPVIIVTSVSLCAFLAVVGYFFNIALFAEKVTSGSFKRGLGGTTDPNNLALMIIVVFPFLVYYLIYSKKFLLRCLAIALMGINVLGLVTTFSRSGALVLFMVCCLLLFAHFGLLKPKLVGILIGAAGICMIAFYFMIPEGYLERQLSLVKAQDKSIGRRTSYLYVAWDSFKENPILGTGPGTFPEVYATSYYAKKFTSRDKSPKRYAHNSYVEILVGSGLPGLITFLAALGLSFLNFIRARTGFLRAGDLKTAALVQTFGISYTGLFLYILVFSEPLHKHLLVLLVMSQVVCRYLPEEIKSAS